MNLHTKPDHDGYDVVIIGGAIIGSSVAWWTMRNSDFTGRILVVERDPTYQFASTTHTNSCIRQQFGTKINILISQFGVEFIKGFGAFMNDAEAPQISINCHGYLYLADSLAFAEVLKTNQKLQASLSAGTQIISRDQIAAAYPFFNLDDIVLGSHNPVNEGYFDGGTIFTWFRKKSRELGAEFIRNEVTGITRKENRVTGVVLASGEKVHADTIVNASGPRANATAQMAKLHVPVEPRRRFTFVFDAAEKLPGYLPLTIDPAGVHMRSDGLYYVAGCPPDDDRPADYDDFTMDHEIWEGKIWPIIANRVPAFERVKVINSWVGHYAYNTLDQNAVVGPHPEVSNFIFANGFSGHGLQQSPAVGRGVSELIIYGEYRDLDLSPLGYERIADNRPLVERAII
ncbi:MAG: FAD-binding oxidoreductase [Proteobacteria bacterium]|nr:FAD-binding oxidoreductase [Pseudomonadota bacterium]